MVLIVGDLNDLWTFDLTTNLWSWLGGSISRNPIGSYVSLGVPAAENIAGALYGHSMTFDSVSRVLYVMGGYTIDGAQWESTKYFAIQFAHSKLTVRRFVEQYLDVQSNDGMVGMSAG